MQAGTLMHPHAGTLMCIRCQDKKGSLVWIGWKTPLLVELSVGSYQTVISLGMWVLILLWVVHGLSGFVYICAIVTSIICLVKLIIQTRLLICNCICGYCPHSSCTPRVCQPKTISPCWSLNCTNTGARLTNSLGSLTENYQFNFEQKLQT